MLKKIFSHISSHLSPLLVVASYNLAFANQVIPFGFCPKYNPRIMYQLYQPFIDYLNEVTPYRFEIKLSRVYPDTIDRLGSGEIAIASCGPVSYAKGRGRGAVRPAVRTVEKEGKPY